MHKVANIINQDITLYHCANKDMGNISPSPSGRELEGGGFSMKIIRGFVFVHISIPGYVALGFTPNRAGDKPPRYDVTSII